MRMKILAFIPNQDNIALKFYIKSILISARNKLPDKNINQKFVIMTVSVIALEHEIFWH